MADERTERLLNLVQVLLAASRPIPRETLRRSISQYAGRGDEAFQKMFERDKDDLRGTGFDISQDGHGPEAGYSIKLRDARLPAIGLTASQQALLRLAASAWDSAALDGAARQALAKLNVDLAGTESTAYLLDPELRTDEPSFAALFRAATERRVAVFSYRKPGAITAEKRTVHPWMVVARHGRWYLVGYDVERSAPRVFRLSRIEGTVSADGASRAFTVPPGVDPQHMIVEFTSPSATDVAVLRVRAGAGQDLRRAATAVAADPDHEGWDRLTVGYGDIDLLAAQVASYGPDIVVVDPPALRDDVIRRLWSVVVAAEAVAT